MSFATIQVWEKLVKVVLDSMRMNAQVVPPGRQNTSGILGMGQSWEHEPFVRSIQPDLMFVHPRTLPRTI